MIRPEAITIRPADRPSEGGGLPGRVLYSFYQGMSAEYMVETDAGRLMVVDSNLTVRCCLPVSRWSWNFPPGHALAAGGGDVAVGRLAPAGHPPQLRGDIPSRSRPPAIMDKMSPGLTSPLAKVPYEAPRFRTVKRSPTAIV